jgi:hypothetical protein
MKVTLPTVAWTIRLSPKITLRFTQQIYRASLFFVSCHKSDARPVMEGGW